MDEVNPKGYLTKHQYWKLQYCFQYESPKIKNHYKVVVLSLFCLLFESVSQKLRIKQLFWFLVSVSLFFIISFAYVLHINCWKKLYLQELRWWTESERISYQIFKDGLAEIPVINTKGNISIIYVQIAENLLPARNVKMMWIRRGILSNKNTKNHKLLSRWKSQTKKLGKDQKSAQNI